MASLHPHEINLKTNYIDRLLQLDVDCPTNTVPNSIANHVVVKIDIHRPFCKNFKNLIPLIAILSAFFGNALSCETIWKRC
jgi:hypothetical protein